MKDVQIAVRVTHETKATLIGLAEADHRTLSSLLEKIIAEWLKRQQGGRKAA